MKDNTGHQLLMISEALKQGQRNYLHEVMQGQARISELEAELAALKAKTAVPDVEPFPPTSTPEPGWDSGYESGYNDAIAQIKSAPAQPQNTE